MNDQNIKSDAGKLELRLVPTQIIKDIAEIRMYGNAKYGDSESWKSVEKERYIDALLRHALEYIENPKSVDEESGIEHYKHMACNMAFLCAMEEKERADLAELTDFREWIKEKTSEMLAELLKGKEVADDGSTNQASENRYSSFADATGNHATRYHY